VNDQKNINMNLNTIVSQAFEIDKNSKNNISLLQMDDYFHLKRFKEQRFQELKTKFVTEENLDIVLSKKFEKSISKELLSIYKISFIDEDFFSSDYRYTINQRMEYLEGKILLFNSHMPQWAGSVSSLNNFITLYLNSKNCFFIGWDWDNHHTLHVSSIISACSDIYCHAHFAHDFELSAHCDRRFRIAATTFQWNDQVIIDELNYLINSNRSNEALGWHVKYGLFQHREKLLTTLAKKHSYIGLLENGNSYFDKSNLERLREWGGHKVHWVVPTLNDLPCRVFDALITGGIPILPNYLKNDPALNGLHNLDCEYYTASEIFDSEKTISRAVDKFNEGGMSGILRRINAVLTNHTLSNRIYKILEIFQSSIKS